MKHEIQYRPVAFRDTTTGDIMVIRSTVATNESVEHDGQTLPLFDLDVSSHSHPAYTGRMANARPSDRIEAFKQRYGAAA